MDRWIAYLSRFPIEELDILRYTVRYRVPTCLFSCQSLTRLSFQTCRVRLPSTFKGFPKLTFLHFRGKDIPNDVLETLISSCPVLEELVLYFNNSLLPFAISAPKLKSVKVHGMTRGFKFENTPHLTDVRVFLYWHDPESDQNLQACSNYSNLLKFCALPKIRRLDTNSNFVKYLAVGVVPDEKHISCPSLDSLSINMDLNDREEYLSAFCILSAFPNLRKLNIEACMSIEENVAESENLLEDYKFMFTKLELVEISEAGITGTQHELEFVKIILSNSPILDQLTVRYIVKDDGVEAMSLTEKLLSLRRASARAQVICVKNVF